MKYVQLTGLLTLFVLLTATNEILGQEWNFVKKKDQIMLYTRTEGTGPLKSFKGVTDINGDFKEISTMIGNPKDLRWWGDNVHSIRVLDYEKDRHIQYYLVYDAPWPFTDRDLVTDVQITTDTLTGTRTVYSRPLPNILPENPELVRVTSYWQKWTIQPVKKGVVHLTLEGFIDPAGNVPDWLYNMVVVDTPLRLMREVQKRAKE